MAKTVLNLFQAPMSFDEELIILLLDIEEKYGIEIKDSEAEELFKDRFNDFDIKWKPSYIKEFRDSTSSEDWKEWADKWLEENDK